jgi:hypothetical protein
MIDLDDLFEPEEKPDPRVAPVAGLVVAEKYLRSDDALEEQRIFLLTSKLLDVVFVSEDENGVEGFSEDVENDLRDSRTPPGTQARAFASAMQLPAGQLPTPAEALAWHSKTVGDLQAAFRLRK